MIVFITTDTHAGPDRPGWSQQTCCRRLMPEVADGVGHLARERRRLDHVVGLVRGHPPPSMPRVARLRPAPAGLTPGDVHPPTSLRHFVTASLRATYRLAPGNVPATLRQAQSRLFRSRLERRAVRGRGERKKEAGVRNPASSGKRRSTAFAGTLKVRPAGPA